jgi:hypothetical protein
MAVLEPDLEHPAAERLDDLPVEFDLVLARGDD